MKKKKKYLSSAIMIRASIVLALVVMSLTGKWEVAIISLGGAIGLCVVIRTLLNEEKDDGSDLDADGNEPDGR